MTFLVAFLIGLAVFAGTACVDFAHARYVRALTEGRVYHAANWSACQWGASIVGFAVAVKVSFWYLPIEAMGLWVGTYIGGTRKEIVPVAVYEKKKIGF